MQISEAQYNAMNRAYRIAIGVVLYRRLPTPEQEAAFMQVHNKWLASIVNNNVITDDTPNRYREEGV